ncbi:MAG: dephospho-CoA kinase [Bdellovibrionaceae bacterium]|nr:dephospho-CoA kinase [Pseudobdellovibrionaceae bacterium]
MYNIIITGGLGSGKSSVASILQQKAYPVLSADSIINQIYEKGLFKKEMAKIFSLKEEEVNKQSVAKLAFQNKNQLKQLEQLLYPELKKSVQDYKEFYKKKKTLYLFYEAPVFFEKSKSTEHDCILVVSSSLENCFFRLKEKNMTKQQFDLIVSLQVPILQKEKLADYTIFNNSSRQDLKVKTEAFLKFLKEKYE